MNKKIFFVFLLLPFLFFSCDFGGDEKSEINFVDCPDEISRRALEFAILYSQTETEYEWGGQSPLRVAKLDCSGLVVMCYKYALVDTKYELPFDDATASAMAEKFSTRTDEPRPGDLVFMGENDSEKITHIAIFKEKKDDKIFFIDSTQKDADNDGAHKINGVSERNYKSDDAKIKNFGKMKLTSKN